MLLERSTKSLSGQDKAEKERAARTKVEVVDETSGCQVLAFIFLFGLIGVAFYFALRGVMAAAASRSYSKKVRAGGMTGLGSGIRMLARERSALARRRFVLGTLLRCRAWLPPLLNIIGPALLACLMLLSLSILSGGLALAQPVAGAMALVFSVVAALAVWLGMFRPMYAELKAFPLWPRERNAFPQQAAYPLVCLIVLAVCAAPAGVTGWLATRDTAGAQAEELPAGPPPSRPLPARRPPVVVPPAVPADTEVGTEVPPDTGVTTGAEE